MLKNHILQGTAILKLGGVIAYSTETILGLGCDPLNESAVKRILWLKSRSSQKGLILLMSDIKHLNEFSQPLTKEQCSLIQGTDKRTPTTWLVPANPSLPAWLTGNHDKIAVRIAQHPVAKQLCDSFGAIVSTSANYSGLTVANTEEQIRQLFGPYIDYVVIGAPGTGVASTIRDVNTGEIIR